MITLLIFSVNYTVSAQRTMIPRTITISDGDSAQQSTWRMECTGSRDTMNIVAVTSQEITVKIFNVIGWLVYEAKISNGVSQIPLPTTAGTYLVMVVDAAQGLKHGVNKRITIENY